MRELKEMDVRELRRLRDAVDKALAAKPASRGAGGGEAAEAPASGGGRRSGGGTLRREKVGCGKRACKKCADGPSHGPYWYLYYYRDGRLKSRYLGKDLPDEFEHLIEQKAKVAPSGEEATEGRYHSKSEPGPRDPRPADFRQHELPLFGDE